MSARPDTDRFEVAELANDCFVVSATGALDGERVLALKDWLLPVVGMPGARVLVDLGQTTYVDSTTIGVLTAAAHVAGRSGGRLVVVTDDRRLDALIEQTGLRDLAGVERTVQDGVARAMETFAA